jgi:hypothetical protein
LADGVVGDPLASDRSCAAASDPTVQQTIVVTTKRVNQTIAFVALANTTLARSPVTVSAIASSGLKVTFTTMAPSVCTSGGTNGATITLLKAGTCVVQASQAGNGTYNAATSVFRSFTVSKANSKIALNLSVAKATYGHEQSEHLSVTVSRYFGKTPTGMVTITESTTQLCVVELSSGKGSCALSANKLKAGSYSLVATYGGSADFKGSISAKETLTIAK